MNRKIREGKELIEAWAGYSRDLSQEECDKVKLEYPVLHKFVTSLLREKLSLQKQIIALLEVAESKSFDLFKEALEVCAQAMKEEVTEEGNNDGK